MAIMDFAARLAEGQVRFIKRRAKVGDVVVSKASNRVYEVVEVVTNARGNVDVYGVTSLEDGLTNAFWPAEVKVLAVTEAKAARAHYRGL